MAKKKKGNKIFIYGKHALKEALLNRPGAIDRVFLAKGAADNELHDALKEAGITPSKLGDGGAPSEITNTAVHQGIIARVSLDRLVTPYGEFISELEPSADTALLLLAEVQDPHNVGALIRSAAAFGMSGVLIPRHNQSPVTGAVAKVSAGMVFHVPVVDIGNVNTTIDDLKERGFWVYGLAGEATASANEESYDRPSVFIMGNESTGLREKTREHCDFLISIPMHPQCESLNVAASGAVAMYTWSLQHPRALKK